VRANLVVVRCGKDSLHPAWTAGEGPRNFDVLRCPFEEAPPQSDLPTLERTISGQKWSGLFDLLGAERVWRDYDYVWLPDDDLATDAADLSRFFELCRRYDAALAAPALTEGSHYSHPLTLRNRSFVARATTFVEIMAPCFRRDVLEALLPTFEGPPDALRWGLDDVWARCLGYRGLHVIDEVAVVHGRPVGNARSRARRRASMAEMRALHARYGAGELRKTRGGIEPGGAWLDERSDRFLPTYLEGYAWLTDRKPSVLPRLRRDQADDPDRWLREHPR